MRVHQMALGQSSGVPVEADFWFMHTLGKREYGNAKVTRLAIFASKAGFGSGTLHSVKYWRVGNPVASVDSCRPDLGKRIRWRLKPPS